VLKNFFLKIIRKRKRSLLYPEQWVIKPTDKIAILSPHPDDEMIGCGGLLCKYGSQCDVYLLTDGRYGDPDINPKKMVEIRLKEFTSVMNIVNVNSYKCLGIEDSHLLENKKEFSKLSLKEYDYILIPNPSDSHPDHMAVSRMLKKQQYGTAQIVYYEIWNTLNPTHYIDITDVKDKKASIINMYKSQTKHINYSDRILSLNHYRGICHNLDYEESYQFKY